METYQRTFVELAIQCNALGFGEYQLKSGRISPYFFNAGIFCQGADLAVLSECYADAIVASGVEFDVLFGPAYKGIPLAATTAVALANKYNRDVPYCFNRKEAKSHGEGGSLVGAPLEGRVLIVDDVITAGTAIREVIGIIEQSTATIAGVMVGLDRKESAVDGGLSAVQEIKQGYGFPVASIVNIDSIIEYLASNNDLQAHIGTIKAYRERYGVE